MILLGFLRWNRVFEGLDADVSLKAIILNNYIVLHMLIDWSIQINLTSILYWLLPYNSSCLVVRRYFCRNTLYVVTIRVWPYWLLYLRKLKFNKIPILRISVDKCNVLVQLFSNCIVRLRKNDSNPEKLKVPVTIFFAYYKYTIKFMTRSIYSLETSFLESVMFFCTEVLLCVT